MAIKNAQAQNALAAPDGSCWSDDNSSVAVIVIDINHFKSINDAFGHGIGDQVLCHIIEAKFNALVEDLILAMEQEHIAVSAQNRLLALLAPMRPQIIHI